MTVSASALLPLLVVLTAALDVTIVHLALAGRESYTLLAAFAGLFVVTYVALASAYRYASRARGGPASTSKT